MLEEENRTPVFGDKLALIPSKSSPKRDFGSERVWYSRDGVMRRFIRRVRLQGDLKWLDTTQHLRTGICKSCISTDELLGECDYKATSHRSPLQR